MIKRILFIIFIYGMGFLTAIAGVILLTFLYIKPINEKYYSALSKWQIVECNDVLLYIDNLQVGTQPNVWFTLGIERDKKTRLLQNIGIVKRQEKEKPEGVFVYKSQGTYDVPMACYESSGLLWRDLNNDGIFDEFINYKNGKRKIYVNGEWIYGIGGKDVSTEEGLYRFDPNSGEWKLIASNPIHENQ